MTVLDWDRTVVMTFGKPDVQLTIRRVGEAARTVNVPGGMTPREFAETIHGFDGYTVTGFGYGLDDEHPSDCAFCASGEAGRHNYETLNGE